MSYNREKINEVNPDAITWDDMDEAIVGISDSGRVIYDIYKMECLVYDENKVFVKNIYLEDLFFT